MARYIVLLRGINVGGRQKVPMADLRALLAGLGYTDVRTHLQSGNAVVTTDADASGVVAVVEGAITRDLGLTVPVVVRTGPELRAVVEHNPLEVGDPSRFLVTFLADEPAPGSFDGLDLAAARPEEFAAIGRELYFALPNGIQQAKLPDLVGRRLKGATATARNWNTVTRLLAMAEE
ncbi:uncharacterized protein (DUF1697 family) [Murinocardiopsis flavida]|uniref:Uncharacterized protein (DUF1697 family) n=1 Tax=Murinocardiopsis flavida TaxID=645275 RepID=A0A2P8C8C9_9ACTN|nr:DUF1697 domain-containing protein [Murinocardiopsis flavida]PSK81206.1 uncharacterized protein (DUF1697 family) [Murinocardiopsis flavida]